MPLIVNTQGWVRGLGLLFLSTTFKKQVSRSMNLLENTWMQGFLC